MRQGFVIVLCVFGLASYVFAENAQNQVHFEVRAERDVKATAIAVHFTIQKKANSLDAANTSLQFLTKRINDVVSENKIASRDVQVQNALMSSTQWLFGKDYAVAATAKITLRNLDAWGGVAKQLAQLDSDMVFSGVSYVYPDASDVWVDLLKKAARDATLRKTQYESQFNIRLQLADIREMRNSPSSGVYLQKHVSAMSREGVVDTGDTFPSQSLWIVLQMDYAIVPSDTAK